MEVIYEPTSFDTNSIASFAAFYAAYPRQENQCEAERAFIESGAYKVPIAELIAALKQQRETLWAGRNLKHIPMPASWLRDKRWTDKGLVDAAPQRVPFPADQEEAFNIFWNAYPKSQVWPETRAAWVESGAGKCLKEILRAISVQKDSEDWHRDRGRYIPNSVAWLKGERWRDSEESYPGFNCF